MAVCVQVAQFNASSCLCQTFTTYLVLPILYSAMLLIGLPGNVLSIWVFMAKISIKTPTHIYLINLGISNLILCLTMPFNAAYYTLSSSWPASSLKCQLAINVLTPVLHSNIGIGMLILTWLALTRFATLIQHNYGHRPSKCTKFLSGIFFKKLQRTPFAMAICVGTWACVVLGIVPTVVVYAVETEQVENNSKQACYSVPVETGGSGSQAFAIAEIVVFFICLVLVMNAYIAVIRHINRMKTNRVISDTQRVLSRVCRNIFVIQIVLVSCFLPHHIYKAIFIAMVKKDLQSRDVLAECHPFSMHIEVKNLLLCLAVLRCSTDPVIYFLLDKRFKSYVCGLFRESVNPNWSQSSKTTNNWGKLSQFDRAIPKAALKHEARLHTEDLKSKREVNFSTSVYS